MNQLSHVCSRPWLLVLLVIGFVTGHLILFQIAGHSGMSWAGLPVGVVTAVVLLAVAKHLGFLAALFRFLFRRRS